MDARTVSVHIVHASFAAFNCKLLCAHIRQWHVHTCYTTQSECSHARSAAVLRTCACNMCREPHTRPGCGACDCKSSCRHPLCNKSADPLSSRYRVRTVLRWWRDTALCSRVYPASSRHQEYTMWHGLWPVICINVVFCFFLIIFSGQFIEISIISIIYFRYIFGLWPEVWLEPISNWNRFDNLAIPKMWSLWLIVYLSSEWLGVISCRHTSAIPGWLQHFLFSSFFLVFQGSSTDNTQWGKIIKVLWSPTMICLYSMMIYSEWLWVLDCRFKMYT